ncbi:MAG TPA: hypothetical protein VKA84_08735 [Gemmatimonadaceae bacterium]|nr:hypothetical protein [Gemmatimonadaceae bacterium]
MLRRHSRAAAAALFAAAAALSACKPKPKEDTVGALPAPAPAPAASAPAATPAATPAAADSARRGGGDSAPAPHLHPTIIGAPNVGLSEVAGSGAYVGQRVHVTGRCLGYSNPTTLGPPPLTRSDWQLQGAGVAIFVSGPLPGGCSATEGSSAPITILARVAEDTLPALGKMPGTPRRYLVLIRE